MSHHSEILHYSNLKPSTCVSRNGRMFGSKWNKTFFFFNSFPEFELSQLSPWIFGHLIYSDKYFRPFRWRKENLVAMTYKWWWYSDKIPLFNEEKLIFLMIVESLECNSTQIFYITFVLLLYATSFLSICSEIIYPMDDLFSITSQSVGWAICSWHRVWTRAAHDQIELMWWIPSKRYWLVQL